jgi:hypothetical protein
MGPYCGSPGGNCVGEQYPVFVALVAVAVAAAAAAAVVVVVVVAVNDPNPLKAFVRDGAWQFPSAIR